MCPLLYKITIPCLGLSLIVSFTFTINYMKNLRHIYIHTPQNKDKNIWYTFTTEKKKGGRWQWVESSLSLWMMAIANLPSQLPQTPT